MILQVVVWDHDAPHYTLCPSLPLQGLVLWGRPGSVLPAPAKLRVLAQVGLWPAAVSQLFLVPLPLLFPLPLDRKSVV